jgi:hypothetical protein
LHEGHRNRVDRSSCVQLLASAEGYVMRRAFGGDRIRPDHRSLRVSANESHVLVQLIENALHPSHGQIQLFCDEFW